MNALINVKTEEIGSQFGFTKCQSMSIGKNVEHVLNSNLIVENWKVTHDAGIMNIWNKYIHAKC
jgi:hypothetical protein